MCGEMSKDVAMQMYVEELQRVSGWREVCEWVVWSVWAWAWCGASLCVWSDIYNVSKSKLSQIGCRKDDFTFARKGLIVKIHIPYP